MYRAVDSQTNPDNVALTSSQFAFDAMRVVFEGAIASTCDCDCECDDGNIDDY